jgi:rhodanese-related sulfurtransferase
MSILSKQAIIALAIPVITVFSTTARAEEPPCPFNESRSGLCGNYHSQISPAEAYIDTVAKRDRDGKGDSHSRHDKSSRHAVILDVRSTSEYKAGHPEHAYNVPYPYIFQYCDASGRSPDGACKKGVGTLPQNNDDFVNYVKKIIPNKDTPIYTLCRTGVRSVGAANVLTAAGYTHVRNIWEGFVGIKLTAPKVQADGSILVLPVDLNHDGALTDADNNGWRYHQALPYDTRLLPPLLYKPMVELYSMVD